MITIQQQVSIIKPVYNDDFFVVTSTNYTQPNFQYVCDIYVNGNYITRTKTFPHPTNFSGKFAVKRIVESYLSKDFDLATNNWTKNENSYCYYQLKFGEEFGADSSGTTIYPNQAVSNTNYVWNGIMDYEDYITYTTNTYVLRDSNRKFLTNKPSAVNIQSSERDYLYCINTSSGDVYYLDIKTYDSSGSKIDNYYLYNQYQDVGVDSEYFTRVGTGTYNIEASSGSVISDNGIFPIFNANVVYYTVRTIKFNGTVTSETKRYNITDICTKTEAVRLFFLNKLGGYDGFTFKHKAKINADIKRSNYKKPQGAWSSSTVFGYGLSDRADTQYDTNIKDTITLVSDYVTEEESIWLEELFTSPDVYLDRDGVEIPINITATSYETKQTSVAKLINYTIEFTYSYNRYRQRF